MAFRNVPIDVNIRNTKNVEGDIIKVEMPSAYDEVLGYPELGMFGEFGDRVYPNLQSNNITVGGSKNATGTVESQSKNTVTKTGDAEKLPFLDSSFDLIYSWGVLHHSPNTETAIKEVHRVLRKGGIARIMIYHKYSLTGYMLWFRYALLRGRPFKSLESIYHNYLESPGTKAYSKYEAEKMFAQFAQLDIKVQLNFGDLLEGSVGQRHQGILLYIAKKLWPRKLLKSLFKNHGLMLLIEVRK